MSGRRQNRLRSTGEIFARPALIGLLSMIGLITALVGDGIWDAMSWLTLVVPAVIFGAYVLVLRRKR